MSNINKDELYKKLNELTNKDLNKLKITKEEISYLKQKINNDKLGLVLNFEDREETTLKENYILLDEVKELNININKREREREAKSPSNWRW